ncbi:MAG: hypothetical protein QXJ75_06120 [Candidatus Bathyarchaeia archaeon]
MSDAMPLSQKTLDKREDKGEIRESKAVAKTSSEDVVKRLVDAITVMNGELEPLLDAERGCRYPEVEKILGNSEEAAAFLERLAAEGVLERKLTSKSLGCPHCHSPNIAILTFCPYCRSYNIEKSLLLEHLKCGYIGTDSQFRREDKLICPKCNALLAEGGKDYRKIGAWFECHECRKRFSEPSTHERCRGCGATFQINDADLVSCYSYTLGKEATLRTQRLKTILPISAFLKSAGYSVENSGRIQGKSGVSHQFDLVATKGDEKLLVDVACSEVEVDIQPVITMFAKTYDIAPPSRAILVAMPSLSNAAKQLANLYQIAFVEGKDSGEVTAKLSVLLNIGGSSPRE